MIDNRIIAVKIPTSEKKRKGSYDPNLVTRLGLEPKTPTLKVLCSTC